MAWERRRYRRNKVWIEVDADGQLLLTDRGLASLRYKPDDERTYTIRPEEIRPLEKPARAPRSQADAGAEDEPIRIFTDGESSGNPGPAGIGVVLLWGARRRELRRFLEEATNNEAELTAVLAALKAVRRPELPVEVHTDSGYVIGVLAGGHRAKANVKLIRRIQKAMGRFGALRFVKVPPHAGVGENERADALARQALREGGPPGAPPPRG